MATTSASDAIRPKVWCMARIFLVDMSLPSILAR